MLAAFHIAAPNDTDGNPRRGWLVYRVPDTADPGRDGLTPEAYYLGFLGEDYGGPNVARRNGIIELATHVPVSATYYRQTKRESPDYGSILSAEVTAAVLERNGRKISSR